MALPIRFAPVLIGDEAVEFYERWQKMLEEPDPTYPSKEEQKELKRFFLKFELEELKRKIDELDD